MDPEQLEELKNWLGAQLDQREASRTASDEERQKGLDARLQALEERSAAGEGTEEEREQVDQQAEVVSRAAARRRAVIADETGDDSERAVQDVELYDMSVVARGMLDNWTQKKYRNTREYAMTMAAIERAQQADVEVAGGAVVPHTVMSDRFIPALEARNVAMSLGAQVMDGLSNGPISIPRVNDVIDAKFIGELEDAGDSSITFGMLNLRPHALVTFVPASNRFLRTATLGETIIEDAINRSIARGLDTAILTGKGASGTPVGMKNAANVRSVNWSGVTFTGASQTATDKLDEMEGTIEDADADTDDGLAWVMSGPVRRKLRSVKDGDGRPMLFDANRSGDIRRSGRVRGELWDYPYATTSKLAKTTPADLILAVWSQVAIGVFQPLVLKKSEDVLFRTNQTLIRGTMEVDIGIGHGESICVANNFNPTI